MKPLHFTRRRILWPGWTDDARPVWPDNLSLPDADRAQLAAILRLFGAKVTVKTVKTYPGQKLFTGGLQGFDEVPVEAWDVEDDAGRVLYQLWTYFADSGVLFEASTTKRIAPIIQGCFQGEDYGKLTPEKALDLGRRLQAASEAARREHPDSDLGSVEFAD
jgi:hypothetical protein